MTHSNRNNDQRRTEQVEAMSDDVRPPKAPAAIDDNNSADLQRSQPESTAADIRSTIFDLKEAIAKAADAIAKAAAASELQPRKPTSKWDRFWQASTSGLFFMVVGSLFLLVAFLTMGPASAIFSFVLVVVGVGLLLFGTGTQSMGEYNSPGYKIGIAGGAGVVAFIVALGIVHYSPQMKSAFQIEKKYVLVKIEPKSDGNSTFANYVPEFTIDGTSIPAMRRGRFMMIYVPYLESDKAVGDKEVSQKKVSVEFHIMEPTARHPLLGTRIRADFDVDISQGNFVSNDGSLDFPIYCKREASSSKCVRIEVDMKSKDSAQDQLDRARQQQSSGSADQSVPPATIPLAKDL